MIDEKRGKYRPSDAVITAEDPDKLPFHVQLEAGGMLEIRSEARNYSELSVVVEPFTETGNSGRRRISESKRSTLPQPVIIHFPRDSEGDYQVTVKHLNHKETGEPSPPIVYICVIRPCPMCNPIYG